MPLLLDLMSSIILDRSFFDRHFLTVARDLIGKTFLWNGCGGRIVEVEAYGVENDLACHTATRISSRQFYHSQEPGTAYVYLNYGMYWLVNVLAGDGIILLRALEPTDGIETMQSRRGKIKPQDLCSGPGKLGQALGFTGADHGADFTLGAFRDGPPVTVIEDIRIGISKAIEYPWRFLESDSCWVSVPAPAPSAKIGTKASRKTM